MAKTLDDIKAQNTQLVEAMRKNSDATDSLKTAFNGFRSQIDDLTQQIADLKAAGGASPEDLQALFDQGQALLTSIRYRYAHRGHESPAPNSTPIPRRFETAPLQNQNPTPDQAAIIQKGGDPTADPNAPINQDGQNI